MQNDSTILHLEALRDDHYRKYKSLDDTIAVLKGGNQSQLPSIQQPPKKDGYDKGWSMKLKLSHVLKTQGKFLHIRQISALLHEYEPNVSEKDFIGKLYPAIAALKNNTIVKVNADNSNHNTFWGSKNWIDANGQIRAGYEYDKDQIRNNKADTIEI